MSGKTAAKKMAMTEVLLDFDSMAKDIVNAKTHDKKIKAMDRLYKRIQSQSKLRDIRIQKAIEEFNEKYSGVLPKKYGTGKTGVPRSKKKTGGKVKKMMGGGKVHMKRKKK